jgi:predicted DNA-binding transcriptional regulator YafY
MAGIRAVMVRYLAINYELQRKREGVSWEVLAEACFSMLDEAGYSPSAPPSRRTVMSDIKTMRDGSLGYEAPIEYRKRLGYRYTDALFSITNSPILLDDVRMLRQISGWLRQLTNGQLPINLDDLITRVEDSLKTYEKKEPSLILFETARDAFGKQWMRPLYDSILNKQALDITYRPFVDPVINGAISPYILREYNNRWFLLAYHHDFRKILTFALDRIISINTLQLTDFYIDPSFSVKHWFKDVIGVSKPFGKQAFQIHILATEIRAKYLRTKPLHNSQIEGETANKLVNFSIHVIPNYELEMQLLSFGEDVEVVAPAALRLRLQDRLRSALSRYDS